MKVLIACEFSGIVRDAFIKKEHNAISCDLLPTEKPGPHYQGDVFDIINDGFDLMIAHPPCTYLSRVAIQHNKKPDRLDLREKGIIFFKRLLTANILKIAIENPVPQKYVTDKVGRWSQSIHPYYFGDPFSKKTCLWLINLPLLKHYEYEELFNKKTHVNRGEFYKNNSGRTNAKWYSCSKKSRSKTFQGVANAMAEQWG